MPATRGTAACPAASRPVRAPAGPFPSMSASSRQRLPATTVSVVSRSNCHFHAIRHHGDQAVLEKHYVPRRSQRTRAVLIFFVSQDHAAADMVYANADITKAEQAAASPTSTPTARSPPCWVRPACWPPRRAVPPHLRDAVLAAGRHRAAAVQARLLHGRRRGPGRRRAHHPGDQVPELCRGCRYAERCHGAPRLWHRRPGIFGIIAWP